MPDDPSPGDIYLSNQVKQLVSFCISGVAPVGPVQERCIAACDECATIRYKVD